MKAAVTIRERLEECCKALDKRAITPPIEITVGDYSFYPYRGFGDLLGREDFNRLSQSQLRMLLKIMEDILAMERPELFEAFVSDDGVITIDKRQKLIEYSMDIAYNDTRSRIEEIYPQVTYPQTLSHRAVKDGFIRNDTVHEVAHHADFWIDVEGRDKHLQYLHSGSTLLAWCEELDKLLHPDGAAILIGQVREEEGYVPDYLLENGYLPEEIDRMLRAEFFAIAGEYYYGRRQIHPVPSPLLEAYMLQVVGVDLEIQTLCIPFEEMERRRKYLYVAIHDSVNQLLRGKAATYYRLRELLADCAPERRSSIVEMIEKLVCGIIRQVVQDVRIQARIPKPAEAENAPV